MNAMPAAQAETISLSAFVAQYDYHRLSSQGDRFDAFIAAVAGGWQLNIYASEGHPGVEDVGFDEAEDAAVQAVGLVYLTRARS